MRKKTAFIFVLLANFVLMVHAVIPHHHHSEKPTEIAIECNHQEEHSHHNKLPVCNDDHEQGETSPCILNMAMLIPNNDLKTNAPLEQINTSDALLFTLLFFNHSIVSGSDDLMKGTDSVPIHLRFTIPSQGLRAPPSC